MNKIEFVDLKKQYDNIKNDIDKSIQSVINDRAFIGTNSNKYVKQFEQDFSDFHNTNHCIACANGTDALEIALKALNIGIGDEVIVPALTWISTAEAVNNVGAKPIFVDILEDYFTIDPSLIIEKVNENTKAIIPVHLYGHPAKMEQISLIARKYNLKIIEDCAQAHDASINNKKVGTFGDIGTFSFFPGKNLGAYGDAGGIITNSVELALKCRMISQHGQLDKKHEHITIGRNSRMDGIQAAILSAKLKYLASNTEERIKIAKYYKKKINNQFILPNIDNNHRHVFHLFVIRHKERNLIKEELAKNNISSAIQYPLPLPYLDVYKNENIENNFPIAKKVTEEIISIPIYPELETKELDHIINTLNSFSICK
ncbi:DegT/DnrJ/EryC1/StrS family aminotransferase [Flammeovirga agarivorans]|uniref:DegT/DnrJ/EryC1/StrS family aminotransferase n=1 Tax=Flammeovirga agarivorans TaxID=2726742 RepID=A0A7X8SHT0_9BACT|nr:DegT/DnrJ/EryC1/StrS family aminotransferase [Flammeovirga agarivorans]NLR90504.1 DegT/DnrJ/EryC1/StrS family aminotransferase [Flammeovirga agarivorans]